jgi:hypothetical protein
MLANSAELDLVSLWHAVDEATGGALYALRYECQSNGWTPNMWAQTPEDGGPCGLTRVMFIGIDGVGRTKYYDTALIRDTGGIGVRINLNETTRQAAAAVQRIHVGLARIHAGLEPIPYTEEVRGLN